MMKARLPAADVLKFDTFSAACDCNEMLIIGFYEAMPSRACIRDRSRTPVYELYRCLAIEIDRRLSPGDVSDELSRS